MGQYTVPVSQTTQVILPGGNPHGSGNDFSITNIGAVAVYLSDRPQAFVGDGTLLNIGASLAWSRDKPMYAICASNSSLSVSSDTNNLFDPTSIASRINAIGVPSIDRPALLYSTLVNLPTGVQFTTPVFDFTQYQSYMLRFSESGAYAGTNTRVITLVWCLDAAGLIPIFSDNHFVYSNQGLIIKIDNVVSPYVYVLFGAVATGVTQTITPIFIGSYRQTNSIKAYFHTGLLGNSGAVFHSGATRVFSMLPTVAGASNILEYPDTWAGEADIMFQSSTATAATSVLQLQTNGVTIANLLLPAGGAGQSVTQSVFCPNQGCSLQLFNNNAGNQQYNVAITYKGIS